MSRRYLAFVVGMVLATLSTELTGCISSPNSNVLRKSTARDAELVAPLDPLRSAISKAEEMIGTVATYAPSGVAYIDIVVGEGAFPRSSDQIVAHYVGWLPDGTKFESSHDRGRPGTFGVSDVVSGCTEGLLTMRVGGKRKVFVPAHLAYGSTRRPALIPPNSPLIYEFELLAIN